MSLALLCLWVGLLSGSVLQATAQTDYDVIVIGSGVAGLAAAQNIIKKNATLKVVVLEAQARVGGRTWSVPLNGSCESAVESAALAYVQQERMLASPNTCCVTQHS